MIKSDTEIQTDVVNELKWDTRTKHADIVTRVQQGIVTLTGVVHSWAERIAAQEAAHRVEGVLDVANDVIVQISGDGAPSDTDIARAIRHALEWDVFVPEKRIQSTVSSGWVTLTGNVDCWNEYDDAERCIRNLHGVRGVTNRLQVHATQALQHSVKTRINQALQRRAAREAKQVELSVANGTVKLSGRVHTWEEKQAILGAARGTAGVQHIEDCLSILP